MQIATPSPDTVSALAANPCAYLLFLALGALAWMYRDARQREKDHLATAMTIAPLGAKLASCVETLERLTNALLQRTDSKTG